MNRLSGLWLWIPLATCLTGCIATQADVLELENQTDELKHQIRGLGKTISSLQNNQADLSVDMKHLRNEISSLTGTIQDLDGTLGKLEAKIDDLDANITSVGAGLSTKVSALGRTMSAREKKRRRAAQRQRAADKKLRDEQAVKRAAPSPTDLYLTAQVRLSKKSYALAVQGFKAYISKYPKGALIDVATFHLGEAYYRQRKWEDAAKQFGYFMETYPKNSLIPSGRLLYALALLRMGIRTDEAVQYLESIPEDFPRSAEAGVARRRLDKMAEKKKKETPPTTPPLPQEKPHAQPNVEADTQ